jgi:RNA 3'-terminal phosphate cyclase (ATP)
MGYGFELELTSWGFPPEGDGLVEMRLGGSDPRGGRAVRLTDRGSLRRLKGVSAVGNLSPDILRRQTREANDRLERAGYERVVQSEPVESRSPGTVLHLAAEYENVRAGFYAYGRKGKPAEEVAREAVDSFLEYEESSEPVQTRLAERLLVPLMIMEGASAIRTSDPAQIRTALPVARHFRDEVPSVQENG